MSLKREKKGLLWFNDSGKKFLGEKHALTNLTWENDICVYSLTPKGEKQPKYLISKATHAGAMQKQFDGTATGVERFVVMSVTDYEKTDPLNLFNRTKNLCSLLSYNVREQVSAKAEFLRKKGIRSELLTSQEFFSIEVDPASNDPGAQIYLRDKAHFLNAAEK